MNSHYFKNDQNLSNKTYNITFYYKEYLLSLTSSAGVFSKDHLDYGTNTLLKNLVLSPNCKTILDVGCGIGVIGISLAITNPHLYLEMIDVNERAIELANHNIHKYNLSNIKAYVSNLYENVTLTFDCIITNPPVRAGKQVIHKIIEGGYSYLNINGEFGRSLIKNMGLHHLKRRCKKYSGM